MYLFTLLYAVLMSYLYASLSLISIRTMKSNLSRFLYLWILPFPVLIMILRIIRSNAENVLGLKYGVYTFIEIVVLPLILFLYIYPLLLHRQNTRYSQYYNDISPALSMIHNIIFISLFNYFVLVLANVIINFVFFSWVDIVITPLIKMALLQIFVILYVFYENGTGRYSADYNIQNDANIHIHAKQIFLSLFAYSICGIAASVALVILRHDNPNMGIFITAVIMFLGFLSTCILAISRRRIVNAIRA